MFFLTQNDVQIFSFIISLIFIIKVDEPFRCEENFISFFFKSFDLHFFVDILPLGSMGHGLG